LTLSEVNHTGTMAGGDFNFLLYKALTAQTMGLVNYHRLRNISRFLYKDRVLESVFGDGSREKESKA